MRSLTALGVVVVLAVAVSTCASEVSSTGTDGNGGGGGGTGDGTCVDASDCDGQEVCVYADGTCGEGDPDKRCVYYPPTCGESPAATFCGCDGASHGGASGCVFERDERAGACAPPAGQFYCGGSLCALGQSYCAAYFDLTCTALPTSCQTTGVDCSCFDPLADGCTCTQLADGHFEVSCPF